MSSVTGFGPANFQASAAVFNVSAMEKAPPQTRDDVVAPIETTNNQATKADISLLKMSDTSIGQTVDFRV